MPTNKLRGAEGHGPALRADEDDVEGHTANKLRGAEGFGGPARTRGE